MPFLGRALMRRFGLRWLAFDEILRQKITKINKAAMIKASVYVSIAA
jgi:hypothetical protein